MLARWPCQSYCLDASPIPDSFVRTNPSNFTHSSDCSFAPWDRVHSMSEWMICLNKMKANSALNWKTCMRLEETEVHISSKSRLPYFSITIMHQRNNLVILTYLYTMWPDFSNECNSQILGVWTTNNKRKLAHVCHLKDEKMIESI